MVLLRFAAAGLTSRNEARLLSALSVNHDDHQTEGIHTECDEALFTDRIRVFDSDGHRIAQRLLSVREADTVLAQIRICLRWVNSKYINESMHIQCIHVNLQTRS